METICFFGIESGLLFCYIWDVVLLCLVCKKVLAIGGIFHPGPAFWDSFIRTDSACQVYVNLFLRNAGISCLCALGGFMAPRLI